MTSSSLIRRIGDHENRPIYIHPQHSKLSRDAIADENESIGNEACVA